MVANAARRDVPFIALLLARRVARALRAEAFQDIRALAGR